MLDIRYAKQEPALWLDLLFAPIFGLIAYSFLSKGGLADGLEVSSTGFWLFVVVMVYGLFMSVRGVISLYKSRVGRVCCRIKQDGVYLYDRAWYTAWIWGEVEFIAWSDIKSVERGPRQIVFQPKSLMRRFALNHFIWRRELQPTLVHNRIDQTPSDIINAIREAVPGVEVTEGKAAAGIS